MSDWEKGITEFNSGKHWEAHHDWEQAWRSLPSPERERVQAWIMLCGVIYHLQKGRVSPAHSLSERALTLLNESKGATHSPIEISGGKEFLEDVAKNPSAPGLVEKASKLRATSGPAQPK